MYYMTSEIYCDFNSDIIYMLVINKLRERKRTD